MSTHSQSKKEIRLHSHAAAANNAKAKIRKWWTIEDFTMGEMLGEGRYGKVYSAYEKNLKYQFAIDIISRKILSMILTWTAYAKRLKISLACATPNY